MKYRVIQRLFCFAIFISSNPSFNNTGSGSYDGIFHQNNENNWAIVNSAIIIMGNLAVAEANGWDDYYWEIYHLMGDPSLSTYLGIPEHNNVVHDIFFQCKSCSLHSVARIRSKPSI